MCSTGSAAARSGRVSAHTARCCAADHWIGVHTLDSVRARRIRWRWRWPRAWLLQPLRNLYCIRSVKVAAVKACKELLAPTRTPSWSVNEVGKQVTLDLFAPCINCLHSSLPAHVGLKQCSQPCHLRGVRSSNVVEFPRVSAQVEQLRRIFPIELVFFRTQSA